jgi:hypothetical protein
VLTLALPLTQPQIGAVVVAAAAFGVEPWEIAVHALSFKLPPESGGVRV